MIYSNYLFYFTKTLIKSTVSASSSSFAFLLGLDFHSAINSIVTAAVFATVYPKVIVLNIESNVIYRLVKILGFRFLFHLHHSPQCLTHPTKIVIKVLNFVIITITINLMLYKLISYKLISYLGVFT